MKFLQENGVMRFCSFSLGRFWTLEEMIFESYDTPFIYYDYNLLSVRRRLRFLVHFGNGRVKYISHREMKFYFHK